MGMGDAALLLKCFMVGSPKLVYEWDVQDSILPLQFIKARVEIPVATISSLRLKYVSKQRSKAQLTLAVSPQVVLGLQAWDTKLSRRLGTNWLGDVTGAALPAELRAEFCQAKVHKLTIMHTLQKVRREFAQIGLREPGSVVPVSSLRSCRRPRDEPAVDDAAVFGENELGGLSPKIVEQPCGNSDTHTASAKRVHMKELN